MFLSNIKFNNGIIFHKYIMNQYPSFLIERHLASHHHLTVCDVVLHQCPISPFPHQLLVLRRQLTRSVPFSLFPNALPENSICWLIFSLAMLEIILVWTFIVWSIFPCVDTLAILQSLLKITLKFVSIFINDSAIRIELIVVEWTLIC